MYFFYDRYHYSEEQFLELKTMQTFWIRPMKGLGDLFYRCIYDGLLDAGKLAKSKPERNRKAGRPRRYSAIRYVPHGQCFKILVGFGSNDRESMTCIYFQKDDVFFYIMWRALISLCFVV